MSQKKPPGNKKGGQQDPPESSPTGPATPKARATAPVGTVVDPSPTLGTRVMRLLPRVFLLLVLCSVVVIFRNVMLPFALAIFLAYLLFPVIAFLERGRVAGWHWRMPRWTAVLVVYALLFTVGWNVVPRVVVSLASQVQALGEQVPNFFSRFGIYQERFENWIAEKVEVKAADDAVELGLSEDLIRLQEGKLLLFSPPPTILPAETSESTETNNSAAGASGPPSFSLINIQVDLGQWPPRVSGDTATPNEENGDPARELLQGTSTEPGNGEEAPSAEGQEAPGEAIPTADGSEDEEAPLAPRDEGPDLRFTNEAREAVQKEILGFVNGHLLAEGPASTDLPEATSLLITQLNETHLGLPAEDESLARFRQLASEHVRTATRREQWVGEVHTGIQDSMDSARLWATDQLKRSTSIVRALITGVFDFFLILMLTAFFLIFFARVRDYVRDLIPPGYREDYTAVLKRIDTRLSGAIRGQVIICIVNGFLTYPGLLAIGYLLNASQLLQFAFLLSVLAAVFSLIPIFGVIISTIPMVVIALTGSFSAALAVVAWICVIHAIEAYILNPNILGHSAQMNPIIVVFALLAGKQTYGLVGALLAVPIAAVVVAMFGYYRRRMARVYAAESGLEAPEDLWGD